MRSRRCKRLAEITARRASAEMRIAVLEAEAEIEQDRARDDADAAMMLQAYLNGWKLRKGAAEADVVVIDAEEEGARDALTGAFEELKKIRTRRRNDPAERRHRRRQARDGRLRRTGPEAPCGLIRPV